MHAWYTHAARPGVWKATLPPRPTGDEVTITVACSGCAGSGPTTVTMERVVFGMVFICSGQSNMDLSLKYSFSAPNYTALAQSGAFDNVRLFMYGDMGLKYEADAPVWATTTGTIRHLAEDGSGTWANMTTASSNASAEQGLGNLLQAFSGTCGYFGLTLSERYAKGRAPPIGLIQSAIGGSQIEAWMSKEALAKCVNESLNTDGQAPPSGLFNGMLAPFVNMSVSGFLWYQGENNCGGDMGNSLHHTGYGCELPSMVSDWRSKWSAVSGTTDPEAYFGTVTLAAGGSEGHGANMADMRWAQTANYGVLPNPVLPNAFLAQAFDLGDPMDGLRPPCINASSWGPPCVWPPAGAWNAVIRPLRDAVFKNAAPSFMGGIHPRFKHEVGRRLSAAAYNLLLGGTAPFTGPTVAGCSVNDGKITVQFDEKLLRGEAILVQDFDYNVSSWAQADAGVLMVCLGASNQTADCRDPAKSGALWAPVPLAAGTVTDGAVSADVGAAIRAVTGAMATGDAQILAVKYGWPIQPNGDTCCPSKAVQQGRAPCVPASCPLITAKTALPANPFYATIVAGKCQCLAPQTC